MEAKRLVLWGTIVAFGVLAGATPAQTTNVQLFIRLEERVSATDSYIRFWLSAPPPSPSPFFPSIDVYAPSMPDSLALDSVGNWTRDFDSFEEVNQFLSGDWSMRYTRPGMFPPFQDQVENYQLTVDPLVLPPNAKSLGEIVLPVESQQVQEGDWFDIAWDFPDGTPPGSIKVFTDVEPQGQKVEWDVTLWGQSGQGTRQRGPNPMGQVLQREHRFYRKDDESFDLELRFLSEGYDPLIPIGLSVGSLTQLGIFDGFLVDGPLPGELDVSMVVQYTFHPDPTVYVYLVPEPLPGDYNEDGLVDAADYIVWRNNLGNTESLPNDDTPGVDIDDYTRWKVYFGQTAGASLEAGVRAIPEPRTMAFAGVFAVIVMGLLGKTLGGTFTPTPPPPPQSLQTPPPAPAPPDGGGCRRQTRR